MDIVMYIKGREYLGFPFALDVKGAENFGVSCYLSQFLWLAETNTITAAIKSKGGYCHNYDTSVVLDGNSLTDQFRFGKRQLIVQQVY